MYQTRNLIDEIVKKCPIIITIKQKEKPDIRIHLENMEQTHLFSAFIVELIENVKKKTKEEG